MRLRRRHLACVLAPSLALACSEPSGVHDGGARLEEPANLLFVTVDTLRREHLGCYGYDRPTTPNIDRLAAEGLVFERALATMATTYPSHLSLLTGLYPHQHGRTSNTDGVQYPFRSGADVASLAHVLAAEGFQTAAFVSSRVLDTRTGISDGFQTFSCPPSAENPAMAQYATERVIGWLRGELTEEPFFVWLHYWDTHEPNEPAEPYASRFQRDDAVDAWVRTRGLDPDLLSEKFRDKDRIWQHFIATPPLGGPAEDAEIPDERIVELDAIAELVARYDGDLAHIDHHLGRVFDTLREVGRWDDTAIVFTSDHGQALGELGVFGHGKIININTFVPLVMRLPTGLVAQPARPAMQMSLIDVIPTLVARFPDGFLSGFRAQLEGADVLAPGFAREYSLTQEATQFRRREGSAMKIAAVGRRWKYLYDVEGETALYDLEGAGEEVDVSEEHPDVAAELERLILENVARTASVSSGETAADDEVDELMENLRDLGYIGDE